MNSQQDTPSTDTHLPRPARQTRSTPLTISWDEMHTEKVDAKLKRQAALTQASLRPTAPPKQEETSIWYSGPVYMAIFGLLGGLLGWGIGEIMHCRPDLRAQSTELMDVRQITIERVESGTMDKSEGDQELASLAMIGRNNPYFVIDSDPNLSTDEKESRRDALIAADQWKDLIADVLFYGASGLMIGLFLGAADDLVGRNWVGASINGAVGALLGLLGGVAASLVISKVGPLVASIDAIPEIYRPMVSTVASWTALGLFISLAPGLVLQNFKRLAVGLLGGLIGGLAGGLLFDPIHSALSDSIYADHAARLAGIAAIGLISGLATGLIEEAAKTGWLKVTAGLIAGKQFVLYRNPTYIGSSLQCNVYLFNDPQVGKRHAAVHIVPGGFELEDLPLGGKTLVNGEPVQRTRLHNGDKIQIGGSTLLFQERHKEE
jgi:hypothetical protein